VTITQLLGLGMLAFVMTLPAVLLIPRARQSPLFDVILWVATWSLSFIGAQIAPNYLGATLATNTWSIAGLAILPAAIGALGGAFSINILLWLLDRFDLKSENEDITENDKTRN
jgi:hypothetical protein